jgi:hypothetical protein
VEVHAACLLCYVIFIVFAVICEVLFIALRAVHLLERERDGAVD